MQPEGALNSPGIHISLRIEGRRHDTAHDAVGKNRGREGGRKVKLYRLCAAACLLRSRSTAHRLPCLLRSRSTARFCVRSGEFNLCKAHPENHAGQCQNQKNRPVHPLIQRIGQGVIKGKQNRLQGSVPFCLSSPDLVSGRKAADCKSAEIKGRRKKVPDHAKPAHAAVFTLTGFHFHQINGKKHRYHRKGERAQVVSSPCQKSHDAGKDQEQAPFFASDAADREHIKGQIQKARRKGERIVSRSAVPVEGLHTKTALRHPLNHQKKRKHRHAAADIAVHAKCLFHQRIEENRDADMKGQENDRRCQRIPGFPKGGRGYGGEQAGGKITDPCPVIAHGFRQYFAGHSKEGAGCLIDKPRSKSHGKIIRRRIVVFPDNKNRNQGQSVNHNQKVRQPPKVTAFSRRQPLKVTAFFRRQTLSLRRRHPWIRPRSFYAVVWFVFLHDPHPDHIVVKKGRAFVRPCPSVLH